MTDFDGKTGCWSFVELEVTQTAAKAAHYTDVATGDERMAADSAKAYDMVLNVAR